MTWCDGGVPLLPQGVCATPHILVIVRRYFPSEGMRALPVVQALFTTN
jgi:hypothetical protein